jgi:uncharacterized protein (UPF0261 family)
MRDLIGVGLALFLGVIGIFLAYGVFGASNSSSQIQETFLELQQARTELQSYAVQNGGYGAAAFPFAQIKALALLPFQALTATATINQWKGMIALTGNGTSFFADYTNIDPISCARLMVKTPASSGVTGIAVATSAAGLSAATVNTLPVSAATAAAACTGTMAVRFVVAG